MCTRVREKRKKWQHDELRLCDATVQININMENSLIKKLIIRKPLCLPDIGFFFSQKSVQKARHERIVRENMIPG